MRVQRLDASDPALVAPESRFFLRENLKLRLLHARLALLQRDEAAFRADIKAAQGWLNRWFDVEAEAGRDRRADARAARRGGGERGAADDRRQLDAVRTLKLPREKAVK